MFSYLRPHRRTPSNPTSPLPDQGHSWEFTPQNTTDSTLHTSGRTQDLSLAQQRPQGASSPSFLPPINRVTSHGYDQPIATQYEDTTHGDEFRSQQWVSQANTRGLRSESQQWAQGQRPESAGSAGPTRPAGIPYYRPQTGNAAIQGQKERLDGEPLPFVTATDLHASIVPPGRRPAGIRMSTPPPIAQANVSTFEPAQPRSSKTRLNLLNPMSLLARRRTPQVPQYPALTPTAPSLADSRPSDVYDPRIKGTKVHDFSAPRARRNVSYNDMQSLRDPSSAYTQHQQAPSSQQPMGERGPNRWSGGNHTPAFTEDFDEEQYPASGPHVRKANDFTDLQLPKPLYGKRSGQSSGPPLVAVAPEFETTKSTQTGPQSSFSATLANDNSALPQDKFPEPPIRPAPVPIETEILEEGISSSSKSSSTKRRPRNVSQVSAKDVTLAHLPKHMKSTSSRFSFDMIGAASQEKLLEDRHRQKALEKKSTSLEPQDESSNYGDEDFDYDNMFEDDGLEERIPGVNADADGDGFEEAVEPSLGGFTFHSMGISAATTPLSPLSPGIVSTPRDANGEVIGFAITKESPSIPFHRASKSVEPLEYLDQIDHMESDQAKDDTGNQGLALRGIVDGQNLENESQKLTITKAKAPGLDQNRKPFQEDDDLYFDDGIIEPPSDGEEAPEFDESVFDNDDTDEYGRPLRPLSSLPTLYSPPYVKPDNAQADHGKYETSRSSRMSHEIEDSNSAVSPQSQESTILMRPSIDRTNSLSQPLQQGHSLTQDTLSAYQSALAAAAYKAAANGRFRRDSSPTMHFDERDEDPDTMKDNSHSTADEPMHRPLSTDYEDDFDYDDALEDDPIIAEANAEALANDSDGFYGQEFGFYSAPAAGEAQFGGYFGPRGANGTVPNQNGRVVSREPNLTPITERSEYSNRNSIMSLPLSSVSHVVGSGTLNGPGLIQLAGMMNEYDEENMSLEALLKLRRGAWGGSQASLHSSNGNGSPMSAVGEDASPFHQSPLIQSSSFAHSRQDSGYSIQSELAVSEVNSAPASPTLITNVPSKVQHSISSTPGLPAPPAALLSSLNSRPMSPTSKLSSAVGMVASDSGGDKENTPFIKPRGKHHHTASSDSISYMKEDDPVVGERWVLERRRTAESGEVEILGREIVSGGRI
jgi:hypothetical protein